ncbi:type I polyketide synthase [Paenibacillus alvei]|uniref:MxaC n=1 Tax=Paenibacillus alvei TaxID=44250 RepID=A0A383RB88_PAEAL|nr:type I polyketide synthase [Paenibacillus alvei]SYX84230.1 MxaC [Paenibacillus alvei]
MSVEKSFTKPEITAYLAELVEDILDEKVEDYNEPFINLGLVSVDIPLFTKKVSMQFGMEIEVTSIFENSNINQYTDFLYNALNQSDASAVSNEDLYGDSDGPDSDDDVAIVGISCRFPGGANSPEEYWDVLMNGINGICDMPADRWDVDHYFSENKEEPGKMYSRKGGFLNIPIDRFDPKFFNMSPKEAKSLDPQQRLLLELTWEAFENGGINIAQHYGSNTGVYIGIAGEEYSFGHYKSGDLTKIDAYSLTGTTFSTACGRISYTFGFEGPSFCVDTACSSSLTALHLASKAIKSGEVDTAVVGAVNLMISPAVHVCFSKLEAISIDGQSKSFDAAANGYGRGEGGGVLILKRLRDAKKDNDNILGIVRGTAINQDGKSNGLTAPNGLAQEKVITKALKEARLTYSDVDYMEMHGTGTKLGDPIEVKAIVNTYGKDRAMDNPLQIGSVKSNIGHLEAAAGVASIIKVLLAFKNEVIPANLNFNEPNPFIPWEKSPVSVIAENTAWNGEGRVRRVGVNGFGFGGSNAHIILEEPPKKEVTQIMDTDPITIVKIAAKSEKALVENMKSNLAYLKRNPQIALNDFAYTNNKAKADFAYRLTVTGQNREELVNRLQAYIDTNNKEGISTRHREHIDMHQDTKLVFLFTGQGSQYVGMGKELYEHNPSFQLAFDQCDRLFEPYINKSLVEMIYSDKYTGKDIARTLYAQPLIFSIEYALLKFWESVGVTPEIVLGHSIGEYTAAVASGILTLEDAVKLVALRGQLMDSAPGEGAMSAIYTSKTVIENLLRGYEGKVSIALHNAEESIVISGERDAVEAISTEAENRKVKVNRLHVSHAFHSHLMIPILEQFRDVAQNEVEFRSTRLTYISATLGRAVEQDEVLDATYWTNHIKDKVDFYHALSQLQDAQNTIFLEIGANNTLCSLGKLILNKEHLLLNSLDMKKNAWEQIMHCLGELYCHGVSILWEGLETSFNRSYNRVALPAYVFDREASYWMQPVCSHEDSTPALAGTDYHPLIGQRISTPYLKNSALYQSTYTVENPYFMQEHIIFDTAIAPAAAHMSMLISIAKDFRKPVSSTISNVEFHAPLTAIQDEKRVVQFLIEDTNLEQMKFELVSTDKQSQHENWMTHCKGNILMSQEQERESEKRVSIDELTNKYPEVTSGYNAYDVMKKFGFQLGDGFTRISKVWKGEAEGLCYIDPKKDIPNGKDYIVYAGTIDSIFQSIFFVSELSMRMDSQSEAYALKTAIPISLGKLKYHYRDAESYWCHIKVDDSQQSGVVGDIDVYNEKGEIVFEIERLMAKITERDTLLKEINNNGERLLYQVEWMEQARASKNTKAGSNEKMVLIGNDPDIIDRFHERLNGYGIPSIRVIQSDKYVEHDDDIFFVSYTNKHDVKRLLENIASRYGKDICKLIYVSTADEAKLNNLTADQLIDTVEKECSGLLHLVQSITELNYSNKMKIKVITNNVHQIDDAVKGAATSLYQAPLWGFTEVIRLEHTLLWDGIIDTDTHMLKNEIDDIINEILHGEEKQVVLGEQHKRYIPRLIRNSKSRANKEELAIRIDDDAAYLITGGTGSIGQVYTEYLIDRGAKNIILVSRSKASGKLLETMSLWKEKGVHITLEQADVSDEADVIAMVQKLKQNNLTIKGVVHAAGIIDDKMIKDQTWNSFENAFKTKVWGSFHLHHALQDESLDFFVMMSSISSVVGNMGQANYAAANYFMNRFAAYRRSLGMPAMSICWGPWEEAGMATSNSNILKNIENKGLYGMSKELGKKMIDKVFHKDLASIVVVDANWELFSQRTGVDEVTAFLSNFITNNHSRGTQGEQSAVKEDVIAKLHELSETERSEYLLSLLHKAAADIIGFQDINQLSVDSSFTEQGVDSLMIFSLRNEIKALLDLQVDISVFFNYPSLRKLNGYLITEAMSFEEKEQNGSSAANKEESVEDILSEINSLLN